MQRVDRSTRRWCVAVAATVMLVVVALTVGARSAPSYTEVFYVSGGLRIQAYLYKPEGDGPFPAVIYNHGSRNGRERQSVPFEHIGRLLTGSGYVALVSERRGYGRSDGIAWPEDVGKKQGRVVTRLDQETEDVLAAVDFLRTQAFVDAKCLGIMGWSFGGIVTMFAVSRSTAFVVAVDQAGGALTGTATRTSAPRSPPLHRRPRPRRSCRWPRTTARPTPSRPSQRFSRSAVSRTGW